jgi:PAS domain-containing protein
VIPDDYSKKLHETKSLLDMVAQVGQLTALNFDPATATLQFLDHPEFKHELPLGIEGNARHAFEINSPAIHQAVPGQLKTWILEGTPFDPEAQIIDSAGHKVWVRAIGETVIGGDGKVVRMQGAIQDVSHKHAQMAQLRLLQTAIEHLNDIVIITEAEPIDELGSN